MIEIIILIAVMLTLLSLVGVIYMLLEQISRLENKLMSRDFTEYTEQSRMKGVLGKPKNFLKESIDRSRRNWDREVSDDPYNDSHA